MSSMHFIDRESAAGEAARENHETVAAIAHERACALCTSQPAHHRWRVPRTQMRRSNLSFLTKSRDTLHEPANPGSLSPVVPRAADRSRVICALHSQCSPQPLRIRAPCNRDVLRERVVALNRAIQELQLPAQLGMTVRRQGLHQIFQH